MAATTFVPPATQGAILCCLCGVSMQPNATNMCVNCLRNQVDITEGIQKQVTITYCKACGRYLQPPRHWMYAEPESKELLTFCIKKIKGLQKVKLVDAGFIWTEPHSKRLKVKLTVQSEVMNGAILQQTFVVEFVVEWNMCVDCNRAKTNIDMWTAVVQVRQHVGHKRTFIYLEQLILKHGAHAQCSNVKESHEGIDFFFGNRAHAQKFVDFLQNVVPCRHRHDKQLKSHDSHSATYNYKYTFSVEIAPICKDDLVCLPPKLSQQHGSIGPLVLCTKVSNLIALTCPFTLRTIHLDANKFFAAPFTAIANSRLLVKYHILDCEPTEERAGRFQMAEVQVARESDFGANDVMFTGRTHLGGFLSAGDMALGYDLARFVTADEHLEAYQQRGLQIPDFLLVRKDYSEARARQRDRKRERAWRLKRLAVEADDDTQMTNARRGRGGQETAAQQDVERFLEELEEDPELRRHVPLYKNPHADLVGRADAANDMDEDSAAGERELEIPLEELLDDLEDLAVAEGAE